MFKRVPLRDAFGAAQGPTLDGWSVAGPAGPLAVRLEAADTPAKRLRGLLGRPPLAEGEAFVLRPCSQVHTIGMRYPIDAVFCDRDLRVVAVQTLAPGRMSRLVRKAWCCFELPAGAAAAAGVTHGVALSLVGPTDR